MFFRISQSRFVSLIRRHNARLLGSETSPSRRRKVAMRRTTSSARISKIRCTIRGFATGHSQLESQNFAGIYRDGNLRDVAAKLRIMETIPSIARIRWNEIV